MKPREFPELFVDDGIDRYYLRGELRERPARFRPRAEAVLMGRLMGLLGRWQAHTFGYGGEVLIDMAYRLREHPPSVVGIPLSYLDEPTARLNADDAWLINSKPALAVELVRADEPDGLLRERLGEYLTCGVPLVWTIDPVGQTVAVSRPGAGPEVLGIRDRVTADPHVPGFSCPVADFFR